MLGKVRTQRHLQFYCRAVNLKDKSLGQKFIHDIKDFQGDDTRAQINFCRKILLDIYAMIGLAITTFTSLLTYPSTR